MLKLLTLCTLVYFIGCAAIVCPDGNECTYHSTCCVMVTGSYGCCPLPKAVCCKDNIHCCPHGYNCDLQTASCFHHNKDGLVDQLTRQPAQKIQSPQTKKLLQMHQPQTLDAYLIGNIMCPDKYSICPAGDTCCLLESGRYGCCQYRNAVCCNDHIHCCPSNYVCKIPYCSPKQQYKELPMKTFVKHVATGTFLVVVYKTCPDDKKTRCNSDHKCCPALHGKTSGCCVYENGVCCSDGLHCCPEGFTCNLPSKKCWKKIENIPMAVKEKARTIQMFTIPHSKKFPREYETCPDQKHACPLNTICCLATSGVYKCCPSGSTCNGELCIRQENNGFTKYAFPIIPRDLSNKLLKITCADNTTICPDKNTCCNNVGDHYLCCPFVDAVCCVNSSHCCPNGYVCGIGGQGICNKNSAHELSIKRNLHEIICPDKLSQCPDKNTCCKLDAGTYGCCPIVDAVCCDDKKHCCPHGYVCGKGFCSKGPKRLLAFKYIIGISKHSIICPGGILECPIESTCCKRPKGSYTCCPLPNASCCADGVGCCPHGYMCKGDLCTKGDVNIIGRKYINENIWCPDKKSQCPYGTTCCKNTDQGYGCCPLLAAVCCKDGVHCCPHNFRCTPGGYCTRGEEIISASSHTSRNPFPTFKCPDRVSKCIYGETCCKLLDGYYGCCPIHNAVCCADMEHCCPHGYRCEAEFCIKGSERFLATKHRKSMQTVLTIQCPDGSDCPDRNTCCKHGNTNTGEYGCCPLADAVCCSDHEHCCPHGYTCAAGGYCTSGELKIPAVKHTSSIALRKHANLICPDEKTVCDTGTCCEVDDDEYICCPLPDAVCCSDHIHCCPTDFKCVSGGLCTKNNELIMASNRMNPLTNGEMDNDVKAHACPDTEFYCPDAFTCCHYLITGWGCCPLPKAVCCADEKHCCREGFSCTADGKCRKGSILVSASKRFQAIPSKVLAPKHKQQELHKNGESTKQDTHQSLTSRDQFLLRILKGELKTCADGFRRCQQYETCCPSDEGYVCCPLFKAICCGDKCCPSGSTCSKQGSCERFPSSKEYIKFEASSDVPADVSV